MKHDIQKYDLTLVTTYLPIIGLCLRACILTTVYFVCSNTMFIEHNITLAIITVLVYIDGWYTQNMFFDKSCGYLIPIALYLFIQTKSHCDIESINIMQIIVDSLWSLICVFQILISLFSMPIQFPLSGAILINGVCFVFHVIVACQQVSILENMIRSCLFYVCNAMLMLFFPFFDNGDKNHQLYNSSCIHKSFHLLFGHTYTLICSYSVIIGIHVNFVYQRRKANVNTSTSASLPTRSRNRDKRRGYGRGE